MQDLERLSNEGFVVEVREQTLLLHEVPYVTASREVKRGILSSSYVENAGTILPPDTHQVWWTGEYPCFPNGQPISQIENENGTRELFPGFYVNYRFSNKPVELSAFSDHYSKMVHYVALIQNQARALKDVDARLHRKLALDSGSSPFVYDDTASARATIQATSARLALSSVALIGLGGTGSYILDQLAKTPVMAIHLFDGDVFLQHNAFRAPGAATRDELAAQSMKVDYFTRKYSHMHRGIVPHAHYLDETNLDSLGQPDFAFVCVDKGPARALIFERLQRLGVPFIDVGMNLQLVPKTAKLLGACRVTLSTPQRSSHLSKYVPTEVDNEDVLYRQNIQVADMNALNAQLAVLKWKQYLGFYQDDFEAHNLTFTLNAPSLVRDVTRSESL
jgi:hypothetical protein